MVLPHNPHISEFSLSVKSNPVIVVCFHGNRANWPKCKQKYVLAHSCLHGNVILPAIIPQSIMGTVGPNLFLCFSLIIKAQNDSLVFIHIQIFALC